MQSEKYTKSSIWILPKRQSDTGLKQRLFVQKVKKHTSESKSESTVVFLAEYSDTAFGDGCKSPG